MNSLEYQLPLFNRLSRILIRPIFRGLFHILSRVRITGLHNVPKNCAYLITCNHVSLYDTPLIVAFWPTCPEAAGAIEIWSKPGQSILVRLFGGIPIYRGQYNRRSLDTIISALRTSRPVLIAPEGGRSHKPGLRRAHPGAAYIVENTNVPVIPVGVVGATDDFLSLALQGKRPTIEMRIGEAFHLPSIDETDELHRIARQKNIDMIMNHIAAILPDEYRGIYA